MSIFEFVFTLLSIVISLALTHLLAGVVMLFRNAGRVRLSLPHAMWMWTAFATTIGNWATLWPLREIADWPSWSLLTQIALVVTQYLFAAMVTPEAPAEGALDLNAFHERERRRYALAFVALGVWAIASNLVFGLAGLYDAWIRDSLLAAPELMIALIAAFVSERRVQVAAAVTIAVISTYFLIVGCNLAVGG